MLVTNQTSSDIYFGPLHLGAGVGTTLTVDDTTATSLYLTNDSVADALNNAYNSGKITVSSQAQPFPRPTGTPSLLHGTGNPEGLVFAAQGSAYLRRDGLQSNGGVIYVKTSGVTSSTGWLDLPTAAGVTVALPPGTLAAYGGATAPSGWLLCDGSAVSRTVYGLLFSAIGTIYGAGDGSTTFNVPDLRGRVAVGYAASGGHADVSTLGNTDGAVLASRRPKHKHTVVQPTIGITDPGHSHTQGWNDFSGSQATGLANNLSSGQHPSSIGSSTTGITATATGGTVGPQTGSEPTDSEAYLVVNHIIKT
jgi:microcystin-dependent protein